MTRPVAIGLVSCAVLSVLATAMGGIAGASPTQRATTSPAVRPGRSNTNAGPIAAHPTAPADLPPIQLAFSSVPGTGTTDVVLSPQPVITLTDGTGRPAGTDLISLSITPDTGLPGATLTCTTNPVAAINGVASFTGCGIDRPAAGYTLTAVDTTTGLSITSGAFGIGGEGHLAGTDAIATSIAVSRATFPTSHSADAVVLARADASTDALAGAPLAAQLGAPLLITPGGPLSSTLDPRVLSEIERILTPHGSVYLLGGPLAVATSIETQLQAARYTTIRIAGATAPGTAVAIAEQLGDPTTIFEVTALDPADALSAAPAVIQAHGALLFTDGTNQAVETEAYLATHPEASRYAIGGPLAAAAADPSANPVYGHDLYATSAAVATTFFPDAATIAATSPPNYPDALSAPGFITTADRHGPLLLIAPNAPTPPPIAAYLILHPGLTTGYLFAGSDINLPTTRTHLWVDFARGLLALIDATDTPNNEATLLAWMAAEQPPTSPNAAFNPLNIQAHGYPKESGITGTSGTGQFNFADWVTGLTQTATFLSQDRYSSVVAAFRADAPAPQTLTAIQSSGWAAGGYGGQLLASLPTILSHWDTYTNGSIRTAS
jgi:hypothetical protein